MDQGTGPTGEHSSAEPEGKETASCNVEEQGVEMRTEGGAGAGSIIQSVEEEREEEMEVGSEEGDRKGLGSSEAKGQIPEVGGEKSPTGQEGEREEGQSQVGVIGSEEGEGEVSASTVQAELDKVLEETARKKNLSVLNVKSILRHVLKDKRVMALVQKKAAEQEGKAVEEKWDTSDIVTYEPKLTRARVRQELMTTGAISPEKMASLANMAKRKSPLHPSGSSGSGIAGALGPLLEEVEGVDSDDSSDEEYNPVVSSGDEEEEDGESEEEGDTPSSRGETPYSSRGGGEVSSSRGETPFSHEEEEGEERSDEGAGVGTTEDEAGMEVEVDGREEGEAEAVNDVEIREESEVVEAQDGPSDTKMDVDTSVDTVSDTRSLDDAHQAPTVIQMSTPLPVAPLPATPSHSVTDPPAKDPSLPITVATPSNTMPHSSPPVSQVSPPPVTQVCPFPAITSVQTPVSVTSDTVSSSTHQPVLSTTPISVATPTSVAMPSPFATPVTVVAFITTTTPVTPIPGATPTTTPISPLLPITTGPLPGITRLDHTPPISGHAPPVSPVLPNTTNSSLVPAPDEALIHETAALLASLSDVIQSPMKSLHCSMTVSPVKPTLSRPLHRDSPTKSMLVESSLAARPMPVESRPMPVESRPMPVESRPMPVESRPMQVESRPIQMEPRPMQMEPRPMQMEPRPVPVESRPMLMESNLGQPNPLHCSFSDNSLTPMHSSLTQPITPLESFPVSGSQALSAMAVEQLPLPLIGEELEEEKIAQRTRSKFPLDNTTISSIEATFVPPDAEDPPTPIGSAEPLELEEDELEWQKWLTDLFNPSTPSTLNDSTTIPGVDEDGDDTEYNYLADTRYLEEEKEEFRDDRAVRISKKEVDDLLNEYLYSSASGVGGLLSTDTIDLTSAYLLQSLGLQSLLQNTAASSQLSAAAVAAATPLTGLGSKFAAAGATGGGGAVVPKDTVYLSEEQTVQLRTQITQHYQLLMQTFVMSRVEPTFLQVSQLAAQAVKELATFGEEAKKCEERVQSALWNIPTMEEGLQIIDRMDPHNPDAVSPIPAPSGSKLPESVQTLFMTHQTFWQYPQFLPAVSFCSFADKPKHGSFTTEEDYLLVMGLDHYGTVKAWKDIQEKLLPFKTPKQLKLRVKNANANRTGDNVIKHYKKTGELKIPFKDNEEKKSDLPDWVLSYHKKQVEREKKEAKKKREKLEISRKVSKMLEPLTSRPIPISSSPTGRTGSSSKRNLAKSFGIDPKDPKRQKLEATDLTKEPPHKTVPESFSEANMEALLHAAGLEVSSSLAQYAYRYLNEVKLCLSDDKERYSKFLDTLIRASREKKESHRVYTELKGILQNNPYLLALFTEFLTTEQCLQADATQEKYVLGSVQSFIAKLKDKFKDSPVKIDEVLDKLVGLSAPGVTRQEIKDTIFPLINAHEDLVREMKQFLYQLAPSPRSDDLYEEVSLVGAKETDLYENVCLTEPLTEDATSQAVSNPQRPPLTNTGQAAATTAAASTGRSSQAKSATNVRVRRMGNSACSPPIASGSGRRTSANSSRSQRASSAGPPPQVAVASTPPAVQKSKGKVALKTAGQNLKESPKILGQASRELQKIASKERVPVQAFKEPQKTSGQASKEPPKSTELVFKEPQKKSATVSKSRKRPNPSAAPPPAPARKRVSENVSSSSSRTSVMVTRRSSSQLLTGSPHSEGSPHSGDAAGKLAGSGTNCGDTIGQGGVLSGSSVSPAASAGSPSFVPISSSGRIRKLGSITEQKQEQSSSVNPNGLREELVSVPRTASGSPVPASTVTLRPLASTPTAEGQVGVSRVTTPLAQRPAVVGRDGVSTPPISAGGVVMVVGDSAGKQVSWTREEDKVILQRCLHIRARLTGGESCFEDVAEQLKRKPEQVKSRYQTLYKLFQSSAQGQSIQTQQQLTS